MIIDLSNLTPEKHNEDVDTLSKLKEVLFDNSLNITAESMPLISTVDEFKPTEEELKDIQDIIKATDHIDTEEFEVD